MRLHSLLNPIQVKMFKKEFITICKKNPPSDIPEAGESFIVYLMTAMNR